MRSSRKQNALAVCAIILCFALTLGLCFLLSGKGFLSVFSFAKGDESVYAIAVGGYSDMEIARSYADVVRLKGGAGYVYSEDGEIEIFYAVYPSSKEANAVLSALGEGAYVKRIDIPSSKLKWAGELKPAVTEALGYYGVAFDALYALGNALNSGERSQRDAAVDRDVLASRLEDIKSTFYSAVSLKNGEEITQVKLAIITAQALVGNIRLEGTVATAAASVRYQLVQLALCRRALMKAI